MFGASGAEGGSGVERDAPTVEEDASRIVVSCDREKVSRIKQVAEKYGIGVDVVGETTAAQLEILLDGKVVISAPLAELSRAYEGALESALRTDPELVAAD